MTISIHALLAESDDAMQIIVVVMYAFLSTLSLRRATMTHPRSCNAKPNFYPRSPCGERPGKIRIFDDILDFYPRSPCGERPGCQRPCARPTRISIHALLAESDVNDAINGRNPDFISIHALLAESDKARSKRTNRDIAFLSTLSLRRATASNRREQQGQCDFYPRSPCGERL